MYSYKKIRIGKGKTIDEHRYIMQLHLGRELTRSEVVHHKDGDKRNNDLSNLEIMSLSEHSRMHMKMDPKAFKLSHNQLVENGRKNRTAAKLSIEKVKEIKKLLESGNSITKISKKYNVHKSTISSIKNEVTWGWV